MRAYMTAGKKVKVDPRIKLAALNTNNLIQRKCSCGSVPKLTGKCSTCEENERLSLNASQVGSSNSQYEMEADKVADNVLSRSSTGKIDNSPVAIQRVSTQAAADMNNVPNTVKSTLSGPGTPLERSLKRDMEIRFGRDFSKVRIHRSSTAEQSARDIKAHAYTSGNNIVFGKGQFSPNDGNGRRLLAHELTHVVQQTGTSTVNIMREEDTSRFSGCSEDQISSIEEARRAASIRCQLSVFQLSGTVAPGRGDTSGEARRRARRVVRTIFGKDLNMTQVEEIVREMRDRLMSPSLNFICESSGNNNCGTWDAYVVGNRGPMHLCPAFFSSSAEQKIRTLIHEAAHLSGIGESSGESYCAIFDCNSSCGGFNVADSWAHLVHCLSAQSPDEPEVIEGEAP